ncbi:hypothetical protein AB0P21_33690 [Kribbella sp. NPDC056861]|uniref:hypothetical protein n=1 Tax=Kribbella sp. NPDC056861 TaxID=3154857 RepID=UPI003438727D
MRVNKTPILVAATTTAVLCLGASNSLSASAATPSAPTNNGQTGVVNSIQGVGLPYTFTASGLSGGSGGVQTPVFSTNATGRLCVDPNLKTTHNASGGSSRNNEDFRVEIWQDNSISDSKRITLQFTGTSQPKKCTPGFKTNQNHFVKIIKNVFIEGHLMGGDGIISYS